MDYSFNRTSAIQARIGYEVKNFQTKGDVQDLTVIGTLSDVEAEFLDFSNWASFALNYRHTFFGGFFATAGVHFNFLAEPIKSEVNITSKNQNVTVTNLLSVYAASQNPDLTLYFKDNYRVTMKGEAKDEIIYKNRTAIDLGLGYQFKIGKHFSIVPQARLQYFITPPIQDQVFNDVIIGTNIPLTTEFKNKRLHTVQFILGLWYNF